MKNSKLDFKNLGKMPLLVFVLIFIFSCQPAFARGGRSNAGGPDVETCAYCPLLSAGIGAVSSAIGQGVAGAFSANPDVSQYGFFGNIGFSNWAASFPISSATSEVSRAVSTGCQYAGADPRAGLFAGALLSGVAGGWINPEGLGATNIWDGMAIGGLEGAVKGAVLAGAADDRGRVSPGASALAGLAGDVTADFFRGGFADVATTTFSPEGRALNSFSFGRNDFDFSNAIDRLGKNLPQDLASAALNAGIGYAAQSVKPEHRDMVYAALSGLGPIVNSLTSPENLGLEQRTYVLTGDISGTPYHNYVPLQDYRGARYIDNANPTHALGNTRYEAIEAYHTGVYPAIPLIVPPGRPVERPVFVIRPRPRPGD